MFLLIRTDLVIHPGIVADLITKFQFNLGVAHVTDALNPHP